MDGALGTAAILVVTDDRDLRLGLRHKGARTAGTAWLLGRLDRPSSKGAGGRSTTVGNRPPRPTKERTPASGTGGSGTGTAGHDADPDGDGASEPRWEPGRGATVKKGNPRRRAKSARGRA